MIELTQIVGREHIRFDSIDSTNRYALELLSNSKPAEGTVISTEDQTAGRGQIDQKWESQPKKNVTMSVILYPDFLNPGEQFRLNQAMSLAVREAVHDLSEREDITIKWPNDIYAGNQKICGLLIQNSINFRKINSSVVGIGLNVNQTEFSKSIPNATSLKLVTRKNFSIETVYRMLFSKISGYYLQLRTRNFELLDKAYEQQLFLLGKESIFRDETSGNNFKGTILGVAFSGRLKMLVSNEVRHFDLKEIKFLQRFSV